MEEKATPVEEKIILAAIECIEKYGLQGTTNRRIAAMAGVNGAAINYYFRSKEALIQRCMELTLANAFDPKEFANLPTDSILDRYTVLFSELVLGACRYPGITRAHFYQIVAEGKYESLQMEKISEFARFLVDDMKANGAQLEEEELRLAAAQIASAAILMALAPKLFEKGLGFNLCDDATCRHYVRRLVQRLLAE